jgi:hypothetical protein
LAPERFIYFSAGAIITEGAGAVWAECGFEWEQGESPDCTIPTEAEVSSDSTFTTGVMPLEGCVIHGVIEPCHTYYWRVREYVRDQVGPWSGVASFRTAPQEGWDSCYQGLGAIEAMVIEDSACRNGPSVAYSIAGYAASGDRRMIVGRNAAGTWLQTAEGCYINRDLLKVDVVQGTPFPGGADVGSLMSTIPEVPDPPLPTAPGMCKSTLGPDDCVKYGGTWIQPPLGAGPPQPGSCRCP